MGAVNSPPGNPVPQKKRDFQHSRENVELPGSAGEQAGTEGGLSVKVNLPPCQHLHTNVWFRTRNVGTVGKESM